METTKETKKMLKKKKRMKKKQLEEDEERLKLEKEEEDKEKMLLVNSITTKCNLSEEKVTILNSGQNFFWHLTIYKIQRKMQCYLKMSKHVQFLSLLSRHKL